MNNDKAEAIKHLRDDITYPATGKELKEACNNMEDVAENLRSDFMGKISDDDTFEKAEEVMAAVGWSEETTEETEAPKAE